MIHKLYTQQWIVLIVGVIFLIISVYALLRGTKRDKIIALSIFSACLIFYITGEITIRNHNAKAEKYFGTYQLVNYNNSENYRIEILPNNAYRIFNDQDTIVIGEWQLSVAEDNSTLLLLDGEIFGIGAFDVE
ncbi:MAG: hypothetical protein ACFHU9_00400 [Fluviicola sp.]